MNSMPGVLARVPLFKLYRRFGWPKMLPLNMTLSPSPRCNSRCKTCNIWMKRENELTLDEWEKVLRSLGRSPYWFTISGGEPFLYAGVVELAHMAYEYNRPGIINIPTNSILSTIPEKVRRIAEGCPDSQVIINLSLDGIGARHDFIRGVAGNFEKFERTLKALLELRDSLPNLTLGIHSVVSVFSVDHLDELIEYAARSGADQFITEIAEPRLELDTVGLPITPNREAYAAAIDKLIAHVEAHQYRGIARITEAFRVEYYKLVKRILDENDQVIPCYAGWASAQIYADGTVWPCAVRADNLGNLRDVDYSFPDIWFGERIRQVRRSIAAKECHCPLANASYTNMLNDIPTLARVGTKVLLSGGAGAPQQGASPPPAVRNGNGASAAELGGSKPAETPYEWIEQFQPNLERDRAGAAETGGFVAAKPADYAEKTLAAYRLGMKAGGSIVGVRIQPGEDGCAAARLPAGAVYLPENAPRLPLPDCAKGARCGCQYRPVMAYEGGSEAGGSEAGGSEAGGANAGAAGAVELAEEEAG